MCRSRSGWARSGRLGARGYRRRRPARGSCLVVRRHPHGHRSHRGDRRRLGPGLHAEPAHVAADEPRPRDVRALQGAARGGRDRRRPLPRAVPLEPGQPQGRHLREVSRCALQHRRRGVRDRRRRSRLPRRLASRRRHGRGPEPGLRCLTKALDRCSGPTWLLMENTAGAGATIGRSIGELALLYDRLEGHPRLGVCLDSCHLFASGYDVTDPDALDAMLDELDGAIGLDRLRALHINDSACTAGLEPRSAREHRGRPPRQEARCLPWGIRGCRGCPRCSKQPARTAMARTRTRSRR